MWLFFNDCFVSIKRDASNPERVIVRSRTADHLKAFVGDDVQLWRVTAGEYGNEPGPDDYAFKAIIPKESLKLIIADRVDDLQICDTWRSSITDPKYYDACNRARRDIAAIQRGGFYEHLNDPEFN